MVLRPVCTMGEAPEAAALQLVFHFELAPSLSSEGVEPGGHRDIRSMRLLIDMELHRVHYLFDVKESTRRQLVLALHE